MRFFASLFLITTICFGALAHEFHVGMCFVDYDENEKIMFSMIQLESWDFEHWLEDQSQHFNLNELAKNQKSSTSWKSFEEFIIKFFECQDRECKYQIRAF